MAIADCWDTIQSRRSIRKYEDRPVPMSLLNLIVEAARRAPSGVNLQPWRFVLLTGEDVKQALADIQVQRFVTQAPALFVCCLDRTAFARGSIEDKTNELVARSVFTAGEMAEFLQSRTMPELREVVIPSSGYIDIGVAVENMALAAASFGLGSCIVRRFEARKLHERLGIPPEIEVILLLPVGYPAELPAPRPRLSQDELMIEPAKRPASRASE